jgi:hypothetical protein
MVTLSVKIREGAVSRQVRITAESIRHALEVAGEGKPGVSVEVVKVKREDGRDLYEGRTFDAESGAMVRPTPYRSTLKKPPWLWWEREAKVDLPGELV